MRKVAGGEASAVPHTTFVGHSARQSATNPMILKEDDPVNFWGKDSPPKGDFEESAPMPGYKEMAQHLPEAEGPEGEEWHAMGKVWDDLQSVINEITSQKDEEYWVLIQPLKKVADDMAHIMLPTMQADYDARFGKNPEGPI